MNAFLNILRNLKCEVFEREIPLQEPTREQRELFKNGEIIVPDTMEV